MAKSLPVDCQLRSVPLPSQQESLENRHGTPLPPPAESEARAQETEWVMKELPLFSPQMRRELERRIKTEQQELERQTREVNRLIEESRRQLRPFPYFCPPGACRSE